MGARGQEGLFEGFGPGGGSEREPSGGLDMFKKGYGCGGVSRGCLPACSFCLSG